jgi:3-oxoacyl-[acyl-carrier protein] reductase
MRLRDKVAIVTGAGSGFGAGIARRFAQEGARIIVNDINAEGGARVAREVGGEFVQADVTKAADWAKLVAAAGAKFGRLDVLVNNAGFNVNAPLLSMKLDEYDAVAAVARGTWYLTKLALRRFLLRSDDARIINITSVVGHTGNPGQSPYTMAKAGLDALTKSLAQELAGRNIRVNSVAPGFIDTEMTRELPEEVKQHILGRIPLGRMGSADEVAEVVAWLATRAGYVHGTVIHVNGGMYGG